LLKRAMVSLGQVDVVDRQRIEKELILELFPPERPRAGVGVQVHRPPRVNEKMVELDCARRLPLCKAACCRIFDVFLTPAEIESNRYDWNVRQPYALVKNPSGCTYLKAGTCACMRYHDSRPRVCTGYSCARDRRIWADFDKRILNPRLQERLKNLEVSTALEDMPASAPGRADGGPEQGQTMPTTPAHDNKSPLATLSSLPPRGSDEAVEPAGPAAGAPGAAAASTPAEPPDFSALEALMVPEPENKFVPSPPVTPEAPSEDRCKDAHEREE
jgi:hypothetical protein